MTIQENNLIADHEHGNHPEPHGHLGCARCKEEGRSMPCPECGQTPMGEACYNICPNSNRYYSPEQERADDANYGAADRWEGYGDPEIYYDEDPPEDHGAGGGDSDPDYEFTSGVGWPD